MNFCRACMCTISSKLKPLFTTENISDLLQSITNLQISKSDGLPTTICLDCIEKIRQFNVFKIQCIRSDTLFKRKLNKSTKTDHTNAKPVLDLDSIKFESIKVETIQSIKIEANDNETNAFDAFDNYDYDKQSISIKNCEDVLSAPECIVKEYKSSENEGSNNNDSNHDEIINQISSDESFGEDDNNLVITAPTIKKVQRFPKRTKPKNLEKVEYKKRKLEFPFTCNICNRGFLYLEKYAGHLREHEGKRAAVCDICNNEYTQFNSLLQHMRNEHKDDANVKYKCDCGKIFIYEIAFNEHKLTHKERPRGRRNNLHVCERCGTSFDASIKLKKHLLVHTTETPFACDQCGKQYKTEYRLKTHQFRHKNIRNFKCTICEKSFITRPELRIHINSHNSEPNFDCNLCGKMFRQKSQVTMHMRTHEALYV